MKIIVAGSRNITNQDLVFRVIENSPFRNKIKEIVHGGCRGVDQLSGEWAKRNNIKTKVFLADWDEFGKLAGPIRNRSMAKYVAENKGALIALWDGSSRGTRNMIDRALDYGLSVYVYKVVSCE